MRSFRALDHGDYPDLDCAPNVLEEMAADWRDGLNVMANAR